MADGTKIEWTDATWNPITGCAVVSPGCTHCYAMKLAGTRLKHHPSRDGLTRDTKAGPVWTGEVRLNQEWLDQPLRWKAPRMIFVCAHGDLFAENVPDEWIDRVFAVMALAPQHTFQVLTKRAERMRDYMLERWQGTRAVKLPDGLHVPAGGETGRRVQIEEACQPILDAMGWADPTKDELWTSDGKCRAMQWAWPLPNVWLGVSTEDQKRWDERTALLGETPASVRWVSAEPLLGPISDVDLEGIDWIVVGGESGAGARPMHPDWARQIRDQCAAAGVAFLFKQWGAWSPNLSPFGRKIATTVICPDGEELRGKRCLDRPEVTDAEIMGFVGKKAAGRSLDGVTHNAFPEHSRRVLQ